MSQEHSLQKVYKTEKARLLGFVRRRMRDLAHMDAEDVVADVFANLWASTDPPRTGTLH